MTPAQAVRYLQTSEVEIKTRAVVSKRDQALEIIERAGMKRPATVGVSGDSNAPADLRKSGS